jgi:hypothetical protein
MDSSTLIFHRQLLRFLKGACSAYEKWIVDQSEVAIVDRLKQVRRNAVASSDANDDVDTTT